MISIEDIIAKLRLGAEISATEALMYARWATKGAGVSDFEEIGRRCVINEIKKLESAEPGWDPTFYHTLSYEGDIDKARLLRDKYNIPKDAK